MVTISEDVTLVHEAIDVAALLARVEGDAQGGVVLFLGRVRDHTAGRPVTHLEYEAYEPMALSEMEALCATSRAEHGAEQVAVVHRLGHLVPGDAAVAMAVAAAHREAAFDACRWLIDTLKQRVPIWKKEFFEDGSVWVAAHP
jgi:molybdopterin synthase catalytic subunit